MFPDPVFVSGAAAIGLASTLHCLGMCGGIAASLSLMMPEDTRTNPMRLSGYLLTFSLGRLLAYTSLGALVGALGAEPISFISGHYGYELIQWIAAATLLTIGATMMGLIRTDSGPVFRLTRPLADHITKISRRINPGSSPIAALGYGGLWGFMPCGMVYGMLPMAMLSGGAVAGAMVMGAFALGTWPSMIGAGAGAARLKRKAWPVWAGRTAGMTLVGLAFLSLLVDGETVAHLCGLPTHS